MSEQLQDLSPAALVAAIESNLFSFGQLTRNWPDAEFYDEPGLLWWITDYPAPLFNNVMRTQLAFDQVHTTIDRVISRAQEKNAGILWWTGPTTAPTNLATILEAKGFIRASENAGMAADLHALNEEYTLPPGLEIKRVSDEKGMRRWTHAITVAFEMPADSEEATYGWFASISRGPEESIRYYNGWLNGEIVAVSSMHLGAGVAGIHSVATLPHARRRGIGAAMTRAPLLEARTLGYRIGILIATEMGRNVYHSLGFQEHCTINQYVWMSDTPTNGHH